VLAACGHGTPASKLLLADIAELSPPNDEAGRTARTAARIAFEIASFRR
jgi:arginase family enzyme